MLSEAEDKTGKELIELNEEVLHYKNVGWFDILWFSDIC
jgi:hypothetical protein